MKKFIYSLCAVCALMFASCVKNADAVTSESVSCDSTEVIVDSTEVEVDSVETIVESVVADSI